MIKRRDWLKRTGLVGLGTVVGVGCGDDDGTPIDAAVPDVSSDAPVADAGTDAGPPLPPLPTVGFVHGVASGDPVPDAVVLWTRFTPDAPLPADADVDLIVATDAALTDVVLTDTVTTDASRDWTVKIDAAGLDPSTTYYFQFQSGAFSSLVGRTKTAPALEVDRLRFAVMSCASLAHGYFHVYRHVSELDVDACLFLGDYIYEYATGGYGDERPYEPDHEIVSIEDYRRRYAQYRRDPDLQAVHQQHPFLCVWDDHESANNAHRDGAENHDASEGDWGARKAVAYQAYLEWMPIRSDEPGKIWRKLSYGTMADILLLDTRLWGRDEQIGRAELGLDPTRSILGADQELWLAEQLAESTATWKLLGQQVMVGQWDSESSDGGYIPTNYDQWDGYPDARRRLFEALDGVDNPVVLTGDIHSHWALELTADPHDPGRYDPDTGMGSIGVEFVTSGVTSPGVEGIVGTAIENAAYDANPHIRYVNFKQRGWIVLDLSAGELLTDYFVVDGVRADQGEASFAIGYTVASGLPRLVERTAPSPARTDAPPFAPDPPPRRLPR